jgi:hypothetical protein
MTMEAGGYSPESSEPKIADAQTRAANEDPLVAEFRQSLIDSSYSIVAGSGFTQDDRLGVILDSVSRGLNRETHALAIEEKPRLDEVVEIARFLALAIEDDEFEERLAVTLSVVDRLSPGSYIYPSTIDDDSDGEFDMSYARDPNNQLTTPVAKYPRAGRVRPCSNGQPLIMPHIERVIDNNGINHVGIALNVAVELGDGTEAEAFVRPYDAKELPLLGDEDTIKSMLKKRLGRTLTKLDALNIQSLAEDFGLIGCSSIQGRLQKIAHAHAESALAHIVQYGLNDTWLSDAPRYLMLYEPALMKQLYDQFALDYVEFGAMLGKSRKTREAESFFIAHTRAALWVAEGAGKKSRHVLVGPEDTPAAVFETMALQDFLNRGQELRNQKVAESLPRVKLEFPRLFSEPEIDPS